MFLNVLSWKLMSCIPFKWTSFFWASNAMSRNLGLSTAEAGAGSSRRGWRAGSSGGDVCSDRWDETILGFSKVGDFCCVLTCDMKVGWINMLESSRSMMWHVTGRCATGARQRRKRGGSQRSCILEPGRWWRKNGDVPRLTRGQKKQKSVTRNGPFWW